MTWDNMVYVHKVNRDVENSELIIYSPRKGFTEDDIPDCMTYTDFNKYFSLWREANSELSEPDKFKYRVIRSKNLIRDVIYNNQFQYFFTQTFDHTRYNVYQETELYNQFIRSSLKDWVYKRNLKKADISYIFVPDLHADGAFHYHGLVRGDWDFVSYRFDFGLPRYIKDTVKRGQKIWYQPFLMDKFGYNTSTQIKDLAKAGNYMLKYISKNFDEFRDFGKSNFYYVSQGLYRSERKELKVCTDFVENVHLVDELKAKAKERKQKLFINDFFVKIKFDSKTESEEFLKCLS